ncbi:MAG: four helix bundle protein [Flavobacteriales bacterium]|nr:four helix bundle protein [Flavobacteriales bacterium]
MGGFRDLVVWQKGRAYRNECAVLARKHFPPEEKYRLADQLIRASRAVTAMIAEGHGRFHHKENIQSCRLARGEVSETVDHLTVALDEKYIDENEFKRMEELASELERLINGYIRHLQSQLDKK